MSCNCNSNADVLAQNEARAQWENEIDYAFMQAVAEEVRQSCALPFAVPIERFPALIQQAARYFWENDDYASEERFYLIPKQEIVKCGGGAAMNKIVQLPQQILSVHGCYKAKSGFRSGTMGDFSLERMMMSSYSQFGGSGTVGGGFGMNGSGMGFNLTDVIVGMYEIDTFDVALNPTLSYAYNKYTHKLNIYGDSKNSDVLIDCFKRVPVQCLYESIYFFRYVVALVKKALTTIYGTFEFKLPGGVTINYSSFSEQADADIEEIKEWFEKNRGADYFFQPNII